MSTIQIGNRRYPVTSNKFLAEMRAARAQKEIGAPGNVIFDDMILDEDVTTDDFNDERGIKIYREMMNTETIIKSTLNAIKLPIRRAKARIEPASDLNVDKKIAEEIEDELFRNPNFSYGDWLENVLRFIDFGHVVLEKVFEVRDNPVREGWKKFAWRKPETIWKWHISTDGLDGITQQTYKDGRYEYLKIEPAGGIRGVLFHIANEMEGDNYRGISILRPAYRPFKIKKEMIKRMAQQAERGAIGVPHIEFKTSKPNTDTISRATNAAKNLRSSATGYLLSTPEFSLTFAGGKDFFGFDLKPYMAYLDQQMVSHVLAAFLEQSKNVVGSQAKQETDVGFFLMGLDATREKIEDVMNGTVNGMSHIRQLINRNHANVTEYPKLAIAQVQNDDIESLATIIKTLADAKGINLTPEDEAFLRGEVGLPEIDIKELQKMADERKAQAEKIAQGFQTKDDQQQQDDNAKMNIAAPRMQVGRGPNVTSDVIRFEMKVLDAEGISKRLDSSTESLKKQTQSMRNEIANQMIAQGKRILGRGLSAKDTKVALDKLEVPMRNKMVNAIVADGKELFRFGRSSVREEIAIQKGDSLFKTFMAIDDPQEAARAIRPIVESKIDGFFGKLQSEFNEEIMRQALAGEINTTAMATAIDRISQNKFNADVVDEIANKSMGIGRTTELAKQGVEKVIRSEVLDTGTCGPCFDIDGMEFDINSPAFAQVSSGVNSLCEGKDKCRGLNVAFVE